MLSLHYSQFSKLLHGEGRTKIMSTLLSSFLPVREKGAEVPEILPFLCFFWSFKKYIQICIYFTLYTWN